MQTIFRNCKFKETLYLKNCTMDAIHIVSSTLEKGLIIESCNVKDQIFLRKNNYQFRDIDSLLENNNSLKKTTYNKCRHYT